MSDAYGDLSKLDPGIRQTVAYLNACGWKTSDSGDGVSKPEDERAIHAPHVVITLKDPTALHVEARNVMIALGLDDITPRSHPTISIEATYSPIDRATTILVYGYGDVELATFVTSRSKPGGGMVGVDSWWGPNT